ncbi:MAG: cobalamin biosynthesis protein CobW, partial [Firmicutes bacterium]|nr:cobalamin biosynthesis protein CobW [Bacillota bacterium]
MTGFLGAGKTTLLKELLNMLSDKKAGLVINEFGK